MPFLAGQSAWPSALSRARSLRLSERSERPLTGGAGGPGAGFQQEGQKTRAGWLSRTNSFEMIIYVAGPQAPFRNTVKSEDLLKPIGTHILFGSPLSRRTHRLGRALVHGLTLRLNLTC